MPLSDLESSGDEQEHLSAEGHEDHDEEDDIHTHLTRAASSVKTATTTAAGTGTATTAATTAAAARLLSSSNSSSAAARLMVPASATGRGAGGDNKLRACMLCGLVKSVPLFRVNGKNMEPRFSFFPIRYDGNS